MKQKKALRGTQLLLKVWYLDALLFWGVFTGTTVFMIWIMSSSTLNQFQSWTQSHVIGTTRVVAAALDAHDENAAKPGKNAADSQLGRRLLRAQGFLDATRMENDDILDIWIIGERGGQPELLHRTAAAEAMPLLNVASILGDRGLQGAIRLAQQSDEPKLVGWQFLGQRPKSLSTSELPIKAYALMQLPGFEALPLEKRPVLFIIFDTRKIRSELYSLDENRARMIGLAVLLGTLFSLLIRRRVLQREEAVEEKLDTMEMLERRDAILACVAGAADNLLKEQKLEQPVSAMFTSIARVLQMDGAFVSIPIVEDVPGPVRRDMVMGLVSEESRMFSMEKLSLAEAEAWRDKLRAGQAIYGNRSDFSSEVRQVLAACGIESLAVLSCVITPQRLGILVLQNRERSVVWETGILDTLRLASDLIAAAILRQEGERQLLQVSKMQAMGRMAGGVAHEFNNLLHIIGGSLHRLTESRRNGVEDVEGETSIRNVIDATQRGARIVSQLLRATRQSSPDLRRVSLNETVEKTLLLAKSALRKNLTISARLDPKLPEVAIDEDMIQQVILNLVLNANDALQEGGQIDVITGVKRLPGETKRHVFCRIDDNGTGIPPEILEHIFDPFFTTKAPGSGTGLGLSTSRGIIEQHRGFMEARNRPEGGASFTFFLPTGIAAAAPDTSVPSGVFYPVAGEVVLIADDEPMCVEVLGENLREAGFTVIRAGSGDEELKMARENQERIKWVVTDWSMPGPSGTELVQGLRAILPEARIIVTSGYMIDAPDLKVVDDVLQKPFMPRQLLAIMQKLSRTAGAGGE